MAVGTTWVKELSQPPYDPEADEGSGARRAALALSAGFGIGPAIGGTLAQWAPLPMELPYLVHIALTIPVVFWVAKAPETWAPAATGRSLLADLRVPAVAHPRFRRVVLPAAPWVFGASAVSFAIQPAALGAGRTAGYGLIFATLLTVVTLAAGVGIQSWARRLDRTSDTVAGRLGLVLVAVGAAISAVTAATGSPAVAVLTSAVLGAGYGILLVSGLLEVQRIAEPGQLAGLTAVYYSLTYVGFLLPVVLAALVGVASYPLLLVVVAAVAVGCLAVVATGGRSSVAQV
jgi:hypothetical protein